MPLIIRNTEELNAALDHAEALSGCVNGSDEERQLAEIADAVEQYVQTLRLRSRTSNDNEPSGGVDGREPRSS